MNVFSYDAESGLIVTFKSHKTLDDVKRVIVDKRSEKGIYATISNYLPTTDPEQVAAELWYQQHQLVLTLDPNEVITKTTRDENGDEVVETLQNDYEKALEARTLIENDHLWLKGLLGESAPERPAFVIDVEQFKLDNAEIFDSYNKAQGASINGVMISLNESNQNGISSVLTGIKLAIELEQEPFPINFKAETANGFDVITFNDLNAFNAFALQFMVARKEFF